MTVAVVLISSLLAVLLSLAWSREFRLRRGLQALLARVLAYWRNAHETDRRRGSPRVPDDRARG